MKGRKKLHNTNMKVSLEDFTVTDDTGEGFDLKIEVSLKQYREFKTKKFKVKKPKPTAPIAVTPQRQDDQQQSNGYSVRVYYCGSSGAVQSVVGYSTISYADARKKAWAKVPGNALHASEDKSQVHL